MGPIEECEYFLMEVPPELHHAAGVALLALQPPASRRGLVPVDGPRFPHDGLGRAEGAAQPKPRHLRANRQLEGGAGKVVRAALRRARTLRPSRAAGAAAGLSRDL